MSGDELDLSTPCKNRTPFAGGQKGEPGVLEVEGEEIALIAVSGRARDELSNYPAPRTRTASNR